MLYILDIIQCILKVQTKFLENILAHYRRAILIILI